MFTERKINEWQNGKKVYSGEACGGFPIPKALLAGPTLPGCGPYFSGIPDLSSPLSLIYSVLPF